MPLWDVPRMYDNFTEDNDTEDDSDGDEESNEDS